MKVLVYPHDLDMGGSQMNAIELAARVSALGHECLVFGRRGTLCERIDELGLEFIDSPAPGRRPSARVARELRRIVRERDIDVIHGYEWPPALEGAMAAATLPDVAVVSTVMSMAVAPFLPRWMPLVVGTHQIAAHEQAAGRTSVSVIEPPVDLDHNRPVPADEVVRFRRQWGLDDDRPVVACVSRLVPDLKSEGLFTAIEVAADLAATQPFQLLVVGDGPSRAALEQAAAAANSRAGRNVVTFTGELFDPRVAYSAADVVLGMGGSALRALAFAKPLVVQGEHGFFRTLDASSVDQFGWQGWYGIGSGSDTGRARLTEQLVPLLDDADSRASLGRFGREVVEGFGLDQAARSQLLVYREAWAERRAQKRQAPESVRAVARFGDYTLRRRIARLTGRERTDDFNAVPVAATDEPARSAPTHAVTDGPIVYAAGVAWDDVTGTDRSLATELTAHTPVVWVEIRRSVRASLRRRPVDVSQPRENLTRVVLGTLPGASRPVIRTLANRLVAAALRDHLARERIAPLAVVAATTGPVLALTRDVPGVKVYFATDDFVEAAPLWRIGRRHLAAAREANLRAADVVLAVTPDLARHLRRGALQPGWLPNGVDLPAAGSAVPATDVDLPDPVAGVVGQFNSRLDLTRLEAVQRRGISLLLVGPRSFASAADDAAFGRLVEQPGVQWIDRVPKEAVAGYLRRLAVGLTPYADSTFNRRSYPLKTLEYLAAGLPVVSTAVAPADGLDPRYVRFAEDAETFADLVQELAATPHDAALIRDSVRDDGWDDRARRLLAAIRAALG